MLHSNTPRALPVTVLVLAAVLLATACTSAAQQVWSVAITAVSSLSGCVDSYPTTLNCTLPATIAVSTTGTAALFNGSYILLTVGGPTAQLWAYTTLAEDGSTLLATLTAQLYSPGLFNALLNVSFYDYRTGAASPTFPGISFAYDPPPAISSVSGCATGSGAGTFSCVPAADTLTLTGRGFKWLPYSVLRIADVSAPAYSNLYYAITVLNDSYALMPLNASYAYVLLPQHYNGVVLSLAFSIGNYNYNSYRYTYYVTNALSISFVPLPAPVVYRIAAYQCNNSSGAAGQTTWLNCRPQVSYLYVYGQYLYADSITVGGAVCLSSWWTSGAYYSFSAQSPYVFCQLPLVPQYTAGQLYDVVVSNPAGSVSAKQAIAFTSLPSIASLSSCLQGWNPLSSGYCSAGDVITISGSQLYSDPSMTVLLQSYRYSQPTLNVTCLSPAYINSSAIRCTLPALNATAAPQFYGAYVNVMATFNSSSIATNWLLTRVYQQPGAPYITAVSGCDTSVTAVQSSACHGSGVLTISGYNLSASAGYSIISSSTAPYFSCIVLTNSSSVVTCRLPPLDADNSPIETDTPYTMLLYASRLGTAYYSYVPSNPFSVSFTFATAAPPVTPSSQSSSNVGLIVGVVVAVVVVLAAVVAAVLMHRRRAAAHQTLQEDDALESALSLSSVGHKPF